MAWQAIEKCNYLAANYFNGITMIKMTLVEIAQQLDSARSTQDTEFQGFSTDTRTLSANNLYIAIKGENFDGHHFIAEALAKKASALVVNHPVDSPLPQLIVPDTIAALGKISSLWRNRFQLPLIGVTGSNGKTTLKNMVAAILCAQTKNNAEVLATEGNLNNNIGVPLMLGRLSKQHRYGVIEMGMNDFGEINYLTQLVKPHIAIVNNAATAHLQGLKSVAGVAKAKGEIFSGLDATGIAILNKDDVFFNYWQDLVKDKKIFTFGLKNPADITATCIDATKTLLQTPKGNIEIQLPLLGLHNIMNALAATAATLALDISLETIKKGLENVVPAPGRLRLHHLASGVKIIDDTYNANPASVTAAINTLATLAGARILVLGDMKELGDDAAQLHFEIGEKAKNADIHYLFTFGELSRSATTAFGKNAQHFTERAKLIAELQQHLKTNTNILVKGSRSMQMEKITVELLPKNTENSTLHSH